MFTISMEKQCKDCEKTLSVYAFNESSGNRDGYATRCRVCARLSREANKDEINQRVQEHRQTTRGRENRRRSRLKREYGLTLEQHEQMYIDQEGRCKICCETVAYKKIHTDHDHKTGIVRGLLCQHCNHLLGGARDNPSIMKAAIEYLSLPRKARQDWGRAYQYVATNP